jgi:hypothetical protein
MIEPTTTANPGEMKAVGIEAAAGLAILGAPAAATVGVGVVRRSRVRDPEAVEEARSPRSVTADEADPASAFHAPILPC